MVLGFGIETDIRDLDGTLVISHDPATRQAAAPTTADLFEAYSLDGKNLPLALNIKADGLQVPLLKILREYEVENYFVFDMSVPDMAQYLRSGFRVFSRHSEHENPPARYQKVEGIWLDAFESEWFGPDIIEQHLAAGKEVAVVSPELHGRDRFPQWEALKPLNHLDILMCTDHPDEAKEYLNG